MGENVYIQRRLFLTFYLKHIILMNSDKTDCSGELF